MKHSLVDHHQNDEELKQKALEILKSEGFKITSKRQEIIDLFIEREGYLTALQVHEILSQEHPTMSYNTTYRNLYDFSDIGILEMTEFNQEQWFKISCYGEAHHHHHHFICTECNKVIPIHVCPMDHISTDLEGARIDSHRFEVFGACGECVKNHSDLG